MCRPRAWALSTGLLKINFLPNESELKQVHMNFLVERRKKGRLDILLVGKQFWVIMSLFDFDLVDRTMAIMHF